MTVASSKPPASAAAPRSGGQSTSLPYRKDLDGLRGVAILLVACFHVWFGRVSGGVDVFLTLSGYFFVGSLLRHAIVAQSPAMSYRSAGTPWPRLKRLLKRLLPALFTVLIGITFLTVAVIPQARWIGVGKEIVASALYYQNWYLAKNSQDYLAASSTNSPLQHIWSMSVQGQFFVGLLLIAMLTTVLLKLAAPLLAKTGTERSIRVVVGTLVLGLTALSFYWAAMRHGVDQAFNYYDTFARIWEPLAGGLLAIWMPRARVANWIRNLVGVVALLLILTCGWWINGVKEYPGPMALVPVGATIALIWVGATQLTRPLPDGSTQEPPLVSRLLATDQGVWLGNVAYSLYLIHWPLLIFFLTWRDKANIVGGPDPDAWNMFLGFLQGSAILLISLLLAWLCKRYIEDPVRYSRRPIPLRRGATAAPEVTRDAGKWRRRLLGYGTVVSTILVVAMLAVGVSTKVWTWHVMSQKVDTRTLNPHEYPGARALLDGWPVPDAPPRPAPNVAEFDFPETSTDGYMSNFLDNDIHVGVYGDKNAKRTIALAGGSHAEFWITAMNILGKRYGFKVKTYLKMGCPLTDDRHPVKSGTDNPYPECYDWGQRVVKQIIADRPDAVMTNSTRPRDHKPGDYMPPDYLPIFGAFLDAGIPIIGMRDTPWPRDKHGQGFITPQCLSDGGTADSCGTVRRSALSPTDPALPFAAEHRGMFFPIDMTAGICNDLTCPAIVGNIVVYKDYHHLSATYVRSLTDELGRQLSEQIDWIGKH
ncbi:acyltransferase [Gordonia sp. X0973]|uniref:acyltransferase family protein n=1 Tax=Gordonia sp. X0973 TaxID=2742602 RepID=UPI000F538036|nr:acyltransferase family protein [Gordonia sp. X0973]QKT07551.1 acyltransferase [Gordonia sp. X0973]